ncbi:MAG: MmcQ/YjbR family DNA-binding protein [Cytophagales bacterium]|nr:MmcQ/YjbR family DNA-binding protein [Cytophagales bacterium]
MDIEQVRDHCMSKPGTMESFPFDEESLVFKVMGKMYALMNVESFLSINLKCDPEKAIELREQFAGVKPGYHMSKKHWNTVMTDGSVADEYLIEWLDDSYDLVVAGLPKALKEEFFRI